MKNRHTGREGMAMIFALMAMVVILGALGLVSATVTSSRTETQIAYDDLVLDEAAKAGVDVAVQQLWAQYQATAGNTTDNVASYQYYLTNSLHVPIDEDLNGNGTLDRGEDLNGDGDFDRPDAGADPRGVDILDESIDFRDHGNARVMATLENVFVSRYDTPWESMLTVRAVASARGKRKTAVQTIRIGGEPFDHPKFAVMANNINCILCHAEIRSLPLERNTNPVEYNTFDRVKVAALESLMVRTGSADSKFAGTLYTRGRVYNQSGSLLSAAQVASADFKSWMFDQSNGKLNQNATGGMTVTSFANAPLDSNGDLVPFSNLYMQYPTEQDKQTDGSVPVNFPSPYPDDDSDRVVDQTEFDKVKNTANGSITLQYGDPAVAGSLKAGVAYGVPTGQVYGGTGLPAASNTALAQLSTTGAYDGNLILVGTDDDPIIIDNTVAVNGDVVLAGKIKGDGRLLVKGNTYLVGDVTYKDDPGTFGKADVNPNDPSDYTENAFALVSGGSVFMGDYLTVRGVNIASQDNTKYPNSSQYSIDVRSQNKTGTVSGTTLEYGYFDKWSVDRNTKNRDPNRYPAIPTSQHPGDQFSFTQSELMLFNRMEVNKALADPSYKPRFYGLRESQPDNVFVYDSGDEHSVRYNESGVKLLSDYLVSKGLPLSIMSNGAYHYCSPEGNWIGESTLRNIWYADEMTRPSSNRPWQFDGLIYSNNAVFAITRSKSRHKSNTDGKMTIRGGVIAADLGVLVAGTDTKGNISFKLFYDPRVERFLRQSDTTKPEFARAALYFMPGDGLSEES